MGTISIYALRFFEFANYLNKKEFLHPKSFEKIHYLKFQENDHLVSIKTKWFILEALIIFYEWNFSENGMLIYKYPKGEVTNIVEEGLRDFFRLTPEQLSHVLDIQNGKGQLIKKYGGKRLYAKSKAIDFSFNMKQFLRSSNSHLMRNRPTKNKRNEK